MTLYRIKPLKNPNIQKPNKVWIRKPENLLHLLYGFNAFRYALESLHPEGVSLTLQEYLNQLIEKTDNDQLICPQETALNSLEDNGALHYFLALQQEITGAPQLRKLKYYERRFAFIGFQHEDIDCSLQIQPVSYFLHSSCQAFYDHSSEEFIFKNEMCYQFFLQRVIYTPELRTLIEEAKNELRLKALSQPGTTQSKPTLLRFRTLVFIIKHHLKMRLIGWVLSQQDRDILEHLQRNGKSLMAEINQTLQSNSNKFPFAQIMHQDKDFANQPLSIELLLKNRHEDDKDYLIFNQNRSVIDHADCIEWLFKQRLLSHSQKLMIAEDYCEQLCKNKKELLSEFIRELNKLDDTISPQIKTLNKAIPKTATHSTLLHSHKQNKEPVIQDLRIYKWVPNLAEINRTRTIDAQFLAIQQEIPHIDNMNTTDPLLPNPLLVDNYYGSNFRATHLGFTLILLVTAIMFYESNHDEPEDVSSMLLRGFKILAAFCFLAKFIDNSLLKYYLEDNKKTGHEFMITHAVSELKLAHESGNQDPIKVHRHGLHSLTLLLNRDYHSYAQPIFECYKKNRRPHPHASIFLYFSVTLYQKCEFGSIQHTHESTLDLIVAAAEYLKIKSFSDFWTYRIPMQRTAQQDTPETALRKILEHTKHHRPYNDTLETQLHVLAMALPNIVDVSPYERHLPNFVAFIRETYETAKTNNDAATLFWLFQHPLKLLYRNEEARQNLLVDLNILADQSLNMSYTLSKISL